MAELGPPARPRRELSPQARSVALAPAPARFHWAALVPLGLEQNWPVLVARVGPASQPGVAPEGLRPARPAGPPRAGPPPPESSGGSPLTARRALAVAPASRLSIELMLHRLPTYNPRAETTTTLWNHFAANAFTPPGGDTEPKECRNSEIHKARGDRASAESRLGQEFVFVNYSGHCHLPIGAAVIQPYHSALAPDPDAFGQSDLCRKRQCELDG